MADTLPTPAVDLPLPAGGAVGQASAHQRRMLARSLDTGIFLALAWALPPLGAVLALSYVLVADAIWPGQSPGKRLFGVTVIKVPGGHGGTLWTSVARNFPMAVAWVLLLLPLVSLALFPLMGIPLLLWERHLTRTGTRGQRLGDILGDCYVADVWRAPPRKTSP